MNGDVDMKFQVEDEGRIMIYVEDAHAEFDDIEISVSKSVMGWLYNAILQLFHQKLVNKITDLINSSIKHDVPKALNAYLADLPSAVRLCTCACPLRSACRNVFSQPEKRHITVQLDSHNETKSLTRTVVIYSFSGMHFHIGSVVQHASQSFSMRVMR